MKDCREEWYDPEAKVAVTLVDVTTAAQELARGHLAGPTSTHCLTEALAAAALLGGETSEPEETVIVQMKCKGLLGGFNVECTSAGTLRGYAERKTIDEFDGVASCTTAAARRAIIGEAQYQVTRTIPGKILSQGISTSLDGYFAGSLQRKACIRLEAVVSSEVEVLEARGILVEDMPDAQGDLRCCRVDDLKNLAVSSRNLLKQLGLGNAELRKTTPLKFACRCSPDRAVAMLAALSPEERRSLPATIDITCHMCGRTFGIAVPESFRR